MGLPEVFARRESRYRGRWPADPSSHFGRPGGSREGRAAGIAVDVEADGPGGCRGARTAQRRRVGDRRALHDADRRAALASAREGRTQGRHRAEATVRRRLEREVARLARGDGRREVDHARACRERAERTDVREPGRRTLIAADFAAFRSKPVREDAFGEFVARRLAGRFRETAFFLQGRAGQASPTCSPVSL